MSGEALAPEASAISAAATTLLEHHSRLTLIPFASLGWPEQRRGWVSGARFDSCDLPLRRLRRAGGAGGGGVSGALARRSSRSRSARWSRRRGSLPSTRSSSHARAAPPRAMPPRSTTRCSASAR